MIIFEWITLKGRVQSSAKTVSGDNRGRVTLFSKGTTKTGNAKLGVSLREGGKEAWPRKGEREREREGQLEWRERVRLPLHVSGAKKYCKHGKT